MFRNLKFFFHQLQSEKISYIMKILQMTVSFLILGLIISGFEQNYILNRQINNLKKDKEIYVLGDNNSGEYWDDLVSNPIYTNKFQKLIDLVLELPVELVVMNNVESVQLVSSQVDIIEVSPNFFEKYNLTGTFDYKLVEDNFQIRKIYGINENELEKVAILGSKFKKMYQVGDIFEDESGNHYKILGFLNDNQFYAAPIQGKEMNTLEDVIITPVYIDMCDNFNMYFFLYGCQFLVKNVKEIESIIDLNFKEQLLDTYLRSYEAQMEYIRNDYLNATILEGILGVCLFVFSFAGMLCTMIQRIEDNSYEYAVNLLCGAKLSDIFARIIYEFIIIIMTGVIISFCIFHGGIASYSILLLAIICLIVISIFANKRIDFGSLIQNLRSGG